MNKSISIFMLALLTISTSMIHNQPANAAQDKKKSRVIVYYFHGRFRCATCEKMETYSKETIVNNFKNDLEDGKMEFKVINVEDADNQRYMGYYKLYTKSLILSLIKDDKEIRWKNLDKIWEYSSDKAQFQDYVKKEVGNFLENSSE